LVIEKGGGRGEHETKKCWGGKKDEPVVHLGGGENQERHLGAEERRGRGGRDSFGRGGKTGGILKEEKKPKVISVERERKGGSYKTEGKKKKKSLVKKKKKALLSPQGGRGLHSPGRGGY